MMNFMGLSDDIEIRAVPRSTSHVQDLFKAYGLKVEEDIRSVAKATGNVQVQDLFRAYNIKMEGVDSGAEEEEDVPDVTVPIIEMTYDDSDEEIEIKSEGDAESDERPMEGSPVQDNGNIDTEGTSSRDELTSSELNFQSTDSQNSLGKLAGDPSGDIFRCDLCGAGFRIKHSITKHKRVVHGMHQFVCMFCKKSYPLKRNLLDHILSHKGPHGFKCDICNKVRPNYISIQRHVKTHAQKNIPCLKCGAWFKTKWELKSHEIQHREDRQFNCELCGLNFINPTKLREHMNRHSGDRPYKCDICGKDFNAQGNLTNHRKLHFEEKPFKCQYCSLSFLSNSARKKHVPVHEREKRKPFHCEDCNKKYTSTTSLAVHRMKFHSGGRVYHCHYCKQKFKSKSAIAEHVAEHAAERPHSCRHCLCRYKNKRELRRHQREKEHFDSEAGSRRQPLPYATTVGPSRRSHAAAAQPEHDWEMPEPEVCIRVADETEAILPD